MPTMVTDTWEHASREAMSVGSGRGVLPFGCIIKNMSLEMEDPAPSMKSRGLKRSKSAPAMLTDNDYIDSSKPRPYLAYMQKGVSTDYSDDVDSSKPRPYLAYMQEGVPSDYSDYVDSNKARPYLAYMQEGVPSDFSDYVETCPTDVSTEYVAGSPYMPGDGVDGSRYLRRNPAMQTSTNWPLLGEGVDGSNYLRWNPSMQTSTNWPAPPRMPLQPTTPPQLQLSEPDSPNCDAVQPPSMLRRHTMASLGEYEYVQAAEHECTPVESQDMKTLHNAGRCKPCKYFNSKVGCGSGRACRFCHLSHRRRTQTRPCKGSAAPVQEGTRCARVGL